MRHVAPTLLLATLAAACATPQKDPPPKPLVGTRWQVVLEAPPSGEQPHFRFGDGRVDGFAGCNDVTARYLQDTVGSRFIAIRRFEVGRRECEPSARAVERNVLGVLQDVSSYTITGDRMVMSGSGGTLRFVAMPEGMQPLGAAGAGGGKSIAGTRWVGKGTGGDGHGTPRLEFAAGGKLTGYTGCNMLTGQWREEGGRVVVSSLAASKRMCVGAEGEVEKRFLAALGDESRFTREDGKLVVTAPSGARFELSPADAA